MAERWGVGLMGAIGAVAGGVSAAAASLLGGGDAFAGSIVIGAGGGAFISAALFWAIRDQRDLLGAAGLAPLAASPHPLPPAGGATGSPPAAWVTAGTTEAASTGSLVPLVRALGERFGELAHRQLDALDRLGRDHPALRGDAALQDAQRLARRTRRAAGTLTVLADPEGAAPVQADHSIGEVLAAALADSEHRDRVDVDSVHRDVVRGEFVQDVAHLLAELIDNAVAASSEPVVVMGRRAADGYVLAVVDEGSGLSAMARADANVVLTSPPELDRQEPGALGLSVSGRLAARHGITVQLLEGATDGVIAKVRLPLRLLEGGTDAVPTPLERTLEALAAPEPPEPDAADAADGADAAAFSDDPWPAALAASIEQADGAGEGSVERAPDEPDQAHQAHRFEDVDGPHDGEDTVVIDLTTLDGDPIDERAARPGPDGPTRPAALGGRPGNGVAGRRRR